MNKQIIHTGKAPEPIGPYSQAVKAGGFLYISGQIALNPQDGTLVTGGIAHEAERVLQNIEAILIAAGAGFPQVIKTTIFLLDMADFGAVNEVYGRYFGSDAPARETVAVRGLPRGVQVEISAVAYTG